MNNIQLEWYLHILLTNFQKKNPLAKSARISREQYHRYTSTFIRKYAFLMKLRIRTTVGLWHFKTCNEAKVLLFY
jgi:hypothetical protein